MTKKLMTLIACFFMGSGFAQQDTLNFVWEGDTLSGTYYEKAAMLIPLRIGEDTATYYFQFDTGADASFLYTGNTEEVALALPVTENLLFETSIGNVRLDTLSYMLPYEENGRLIMGTIGANVLQGQILQIDFPNQQLVFSESFDHDQFGFVPMNVNYGRPAITLPLGDATFDFLFDTGSSIFELMATERLWKKLRNKACKPEVIEISSWGKRCPAVTVKMASSVSISSCSEIGLKTVSYVADKKFNEGFKSVGISGVIGNKPFLNEVIVIDISNRLFGVKCR